MKIFILSIIVLVCCSVVGRTQTIATSRTSEEPTAAEKYFTNTELMTQDGKRVRFYTDVLKGKVIVINAFFSTCKGVLALG